MRRMKWWLKRRCNYDEDSFFRARLFFLLQHHRNVGKYFTPYNFRAENFSMTATGRKAMHFYLFFAKFPHAQMKLHSLLEFHEIFSSQALRRTAIVLWIIDSLLMQMMVACETTSFCVNLSLGQRLRASVWTFSASKLNNFREYRKRYENCFFYIRRKRSRSRNGNTHKKKLSEDIHASRSGT